MSIRPLAVAALAAAALALTGCGAAQGHPAPAAAPATMAPYTPPADLNSSTADDTQFSDQGYLADLQPRISAYMWGAGTEKLTSLGHSVCGALDAGNSVGAVIDASSGTGVDHTDTLAIVGSAVRILCPQYTSDLVAWAATQ